MAEVNINFRICDNISFFFYFLGPFKNAYIYSIYNASKTTARSETHVHSQSIVFWFVLICTSVIDKNIDFIHGPVAPLACFSLWSRAAGGSMVSSAVIVDSTVFTPQEQRNQWLLLTCLELLCLINIQTQ